MGGGGGGLGSKPRRVRQEWIRSILVGIGGFCRQRLSQRRDRPARRRRGDELVLAVWIAVVEFLLNRLRTRIHMPGAIAALRFEQELHAALVDRIGRRYSGGTQNIKRLTGRIGIARELVGLRPTTVLAL